VGHAKALKVRSGRSTSGSLKEMALKKTVDSGGKSPKKRLVLFHGIEVDVTTGKRSKLSKIVKRELKHRSESRGDRKSA
jgi:hypothetical protein